MRLAIQMGAHMAELDVQQTADNRLVVIHDDDLRRTTNGEGLVWQKTLEELRRYDAGSWFGPEFESERLASLGEVIALVRGRMKLNIEIKLHGHERNVAHLVVETIRREKFESECLVTSFGHTIAEEVKAIAPALTVGYISDRRSDLQRLLDGPVDLLSLHYHLATARLIEKAHNAGKQVYVWTVNRTWLMRRMLRLGVDGVITNYPDRLVKELDRARQ